MIDTDVHFVDIFISEHQNLCMGKKQEEGEREERDTHQQKSVH